MDWFENAFTNSHPNYHIGYGDKVINLQIQLFFSINKRENDLMDRTLESPIRGVRNCISIFGRAIHF